MLVVQPRSGHRRDEELTPVGVRTRVGHGHREGSIVTKLSDELVLELSSPAALSSRTVAERIPRLEHETLDDPVKDDVVVVPAPRVRAEIFDGTGHVVGIEPDVNVPRAGTEHRLPPRLGRRGVGAAAPQCAVGAAGSRQHILRVRSLVQDVPPQQRPLDPLLDVVVPRILGLGDGIRVTEHVQPPLFIGQGDDEGVALLLLLLLGILGILPPPHGGRASAAPRQFHLTIDPGVPSARNDAQESQPRAAGVGPADDAPALAGRPVDHLDPQQGGEEEVPPGRVEVHAYQLRSRLAAEDGVRFHPPRKDGGVVQFAFGRRPLSVFDGVQPLRGRGGGGGRFPPSSSRRLSSPPPGLFLRIPRHHLIVHLLPFVERHGDPARGPIVHGDASIPAVYGELRARGIDADGHGVRPFLHQGVQVRVEFGGEGDAVPGTRGGRTDRREGGGGGGGALPVAVSPFPLVVHSADAADPSYSTQSRRSQDSPVPQFQDAVGVGADGAIPPIVVGQTRDGRRVETNHLDGNGRQGDGRVHVDGADAIVPLLLLFGGGGRTGAIVIIVVVVVVALDLRIIVGEGVVVLGDGRRYRQ
mmetsp:Transcript_18822/g.54445  ORF Transcript_18822/g.54445 Transcript_18822/m.54445 type:complete len:585 (-) Transcript_18822:444-2198(-)